MWEYMETALWRQGDNGVSLYHVFGAVAFGLTVLAFGEARYGRGADCGEPHDIVMRRSEDGGRSFEPSVTLVSSLGRRCLSNPVPIHDSQTGKTFLFYNDNEYNRRTDCYIIESVDGGKTWSSPVDITADLCKYSEPLEFHLFGPGHGIQLHGGAHDGRLIIPVWHRREIDVPLQKRTYCVSLVMSDDHGKTWFQAAAFTGQACRANESRVAQTSDGSLLWTLRTTGTSRYACRSADDGITWTEPIPMAIGPANICDASLVSVAGKDGYEDLVILSRISRIERRENMELLYSLDGGRSFTGRMLLPPGDAMPGYSDMVVLAEETPVLGLIHSRSNHVLFSRISLQTLTGGAYENAK